MASAVASDATPLSSYAYAPNDGRLTHLLRGGADWADGSAHVEIGFTWEDDGDLAQQILRLRADGTSRIDFDYAYNAAGQLITQDANAPGWLWDPAAIATETIAYDPANALDQYTTVDGLALTYDPNGNRATHDGLATLHDTENRLVAATSTGMSVIYLYDAAGRRVAKDFVSGAYADRDILWAGDMEIAEYDDAGTLIVRYIPGVGVDDRIAMITCGAGAGACPTPSTAYYVPDRMGHVVAVVDRENSIIDRYVYTPFGVQDPLNATGNPFRYTGRYFDAETGLMHYRARYYDPEKGRFLETDPVGYADQMNLYGYAHNNPLNGTDPTGEFSNDKLGEALQRAARRGRRAALIAVTDGPEPGPADAVSAALTVLTAAALLWDVGGAVLSQSDDGGSIWYHGTSLESALSLVNSAPLNASAAEANYGGGFGGGFYLASDYSSAEFFGGTQNTGGTAVIQYTISHTAMAELMATGAQIREIAIGAKTPPGGLPGVELYVPTSAYGAFNAGLTTGNIVPSPATGGAPNLNSNTPCLHFISCSIGASGHQAATLAPQ